MLLLVQHHNRATGTMYWCPPGGGREFGETVEQAAIREVYEETGIRVQVIRRERTLDSDQTAVVVAEPEEHREAQPTVDLSAEQYLVAAAWHPITADNPLGPLQPEWWNWLAPVVAAQLDIDLEQRQSALQAEAHAVLSELQLLSALSRAGGVAVVGSLALGLMVWRDIDIEVRCPTLTPDLAFEVARPLVSRPGIYRMTFRDWAGTRAVPALPAGYYWGLRYQPDQAEEWKIDVWMLPASARQRTSGALIESLRNDLSQEERSAILRLKDLWCRLPAYRNRVVSTDIYDAVLRHHVRTPDELDAYLRRNGKPDRFA
jgi:8-oxo-dGTP pyrophosphatase MutT (NUDIX family)